jgi:pyruvate, water dikinase
VLDEAFIQRWPNRLAALLPDAAQWAAVLHVADPDPGSVALYADAEGQQVVVTSNAP